MATRNPMNERNQEGGKKGTTRKSAASAKPAQKAASSVYMKDPNYKPKKKLSEKLFGAGEQVPELSKNQQRKQAQKEKEYEAEREVVKKEYQEKRKKSKRYTLLDMENETRSIENLSEEDKKAAEARYRNPGTVAYKRWRALWFILLGCGICTIIPPIIANDMFVDNEFLSSVFYVLGWTFIALAVAVDALRIRPLRKNARYGRSTDNSKKATKARKQARAKQNQERAAQRKKAQELAKNK